MMRYLMALGLVLVSASMAMAKEAGGEGEANVMAGTIAQSIAAVIVFLALFAILYKFAWGPILKGLQDRENKIKGDLESAEQAAAEAKRTLASYNEKLATAQAEARQVVDEARRDAEKVAAGLKQQTESEIQSMRDRARSDIQSAKEEALSDLYARAAELSTQIAGRILKREISLEDQRRLVEDALAELSNAENN